MDLYWEKQALSYLRNEQDKIKLAWTKLRNEQDEDYRRLFVDDGLYIQNEIDNVLTPKLRLFTEAIEQLNLLMHIFGD